MFYNPAQSLSPSSRQVKFNMLYPAIAVIETYHIFLVWRILCTGANPVDPLAGSASEDEANFDVNPMHLIMWRVGHEKEQLVPYTRGFVIPYPEDWVRLSLTQRQLLAYSNCLVSRYEQNITASAAGQKSSLNSTSSTALPAVQQYTDSWAARRVPRAVWRGSATGYLRGWSPNVSTDPINLQSHAGRSLFNKRTYMAAMARPYPWLDIGITGFWPKHWSAPEPVLDEAGKAVLKLSMRQAIDLEAWSRYTLSISVDGHGPPWRLARQMLGMTPVAKVESPLKEWYSHLLRPGVHYEPIRHDLHDLASRTRTLILEAKRNSSRLQHMAAAARDLVAGHMNGLSQLDALMTAILHTKKVCQWQVQPPAVLVNETQPSPAAQLRLPNNLAIAATSRQLIATSPMNQKSGHINVDISDTGGTGIRQLAARQAMQAKQAAEPALSGEPGWQRLKLQRNRQWLSAGFRHLKHAVMADLHLNFQAP
ncbi:hypothetical protein QJQ45_000726 [Haematococcus lacustris]|nr:hypothetical protein QJQ45_000726 [Haematococcus lacustris]